MGKFFYQAKNKRGQILSGQIEADDLPSARVLLRSRGFDPIRVIETSEKKKVHKNAGIRIPTKDLQIFTRQFATLISAGIPILDSLKILSEGRGSQVKQVAAKVAESIESGKRLGESLALYPSVFDRLYVNMITAGEEAGIIENILNRLAQYLEKTEKLKKQIRSAMTYPVLIIVLAVVIVTGILIFIVPKFQELYKNSGKELPGLTKMVINISNTIKDEWYIVLGVLVGIPMLFFQWLKTTEGAETWQRFIITSPLFGEVVQKSALARMTRTLSTLLSSGVGMIVALEIAGKTSGNVVIEEIIIRCKEEVTRGKTLADSLKKEKMIPEMVVQMIKIGEASGTLDQMLGKVADFYEDDVENAITGITSLIEPALMVVLGGTIAFILVAMYLPIFDLASLQQGK